MTEAQRSQEQAPAKDVVDDPDDDDEETALLNDQLTVQSVECQDYDSYELVDSARNHCAPAHGRWEFQDVHHLIYILYMWCFPSRIGVKQVLGIRYIYNYNQLHDTMYMLLCSVSTHTPMVWSALAPGLRPIHLPLISSPFFNESPPTITTGPQGRGAGYRP